MSNIVAEEEKVLDMDNELLSEVLTNLISPSILINNASIHCAGMECSVHSGGPSEQWSTLW